MSDVIRFKGAVADAPNNRKSVGVHDSGNPEQDPLPVTLYSSAGVEQSGGTGGAAGGPALTVGGTTILASDEFARVADANAYLAGDAIGATVSNTGTTPLRPLAVGRVAGGSGYITGVRLWTDQKANIYRHRIHFYTVAAPAAAVVGDNVPMQLLYANRAQRVGTIDLPAMATEADSTNSTAAHSVDVTTRLPFKLAAADLNLYYRLVALDAYTPASAQNYYLSVAAELN